jgi:hypothetical protein
MSVILGFKKKIFFFFKNKKNKQIKEIKKLNKILDLLK